MKALRVFATIRLFSLFTFVILSNTKTAAAPPSNNYHPNDHPIYSLPQFANSRNNIQPVIMKKYYLSHKQFGSSSALYSLYAPRSAKFLHQDSGETFVSDADAFLPGYHFPSSDPKWDPASFGRLHLNGNCRVFALMYSHKHFYRPPRPNFYPSVSGMPDGWKVIGAVRTPDNNPIYLGEFERWGISRPRIQSHVLAVEAVVEIDDSAEESEYIVRFPHQSSMIMDGDQVKYINFVLVPYQRVEGLVSLTPFPAPALPSPFKPLNPEGKNDLGDVVLNDGLVHPERDPPIPNKTCPKWLHDIYVTDSRRRWSNTSTYKDEPQYWRTWHPTIDSIYWCYFDHEHGSFPGKSYKPAFGYTAYKTPDLTTPDGRQLESHEGFKVFYLPIEPERAVVFTVHFHVSKSRRFIVRHHTILFTVLRGDPSGRQEVEMELSFKGDFGPGMGQLARGGPVPLTAQDTSIQNELLRKKTRASRTFNVLNIDENFPDSVDRSFRVKGDIRRGPAAISGGMYESWRTTFPSCTGPTGLHYGSFLFDVRDPATAARFAVGTTDENIQWLHGKSLRRVMMINHVEISVSLKLCFRKARTVARRRQGVFYTDPYFGNVFYRPGKNRVRQYIQREFKDITFPRGFIRANDPWSGIYTYNGSPGFQHLEAAISKYVN